MAKLSIVKGATSVLVRIFIQDATSPVGAGKTGLVAASFLNTTVYVARDDDGNAAGTAVSLTNATRGTWSSGGIKEKDATNMPGVYEFGLTNASVLTGSRSCTYCFTGATAGVIVPCLVEIELTGVDNQDAVHGGMSALPNTACTTNASLLTSGVGTDQLSVATGRIDIGKALGVAVTLDSNSVLNVSNKYWAGTAITATSIPVGIAAGAAGGLFIAGTNAATTVTTSFTTTFTGNLTGSVGSVSGLTNATIATAVWTDTTGSDFSTVSSIGRSLYTSGVVPGAAGGLFIAGTNAATTVTTAFTTTFTGNLTGSVGSVSGLTNATIATAVWTDTTGSDFAATSSPGKIIVTQLGGAFTTTASSVFSTAALANAPVTAAGPTASAIATAVWQDATAGDFTMSGSIGKSLFTGGAVPGGTDGLFIAGTNAATTITTALTTTFTGNLTGSIGSISGVAFPNNFASFAITAAGGVTLADGVAHGGTPGSSTATLAMQTINVSNPGGNGLAIAGSTNGIAIGGQTGVFIESELNGLQINSGTNAIDLYAGGNAIYAQSTAADAVVFYAGTTSSGLAVYGGQTSGSAVHLTSVAGAAVYAASSNGDAMFLQGGQDGIALHCLGGTTSLAAILAQADGSSNGSGLYLIGSGAGSGAYVLGGSTGHALYGIGGSSSGDAVRLSATNGHALSAVTANNDAVCIQSSNGRGVRIDGVGGDGVSIQSSSGNGVTISAANNAIALGGNTGIYIETSNNGIAIASEGNGIDIYALGNAIYGQSTTNDAMVLYAGTTSNGLSIFGGQTSGDALKLTSASGSAINATTASGTAVVVTSPAGPGMTVTSRDTAMWLSSTTSGIGLEVTGVTNGFAIGASAGPGLIVVSESTDAAQFWADGGHDILLKGDGKIWNDVLGAPVTANANTTQAIPTTNTPETLGDCLHAARVQGFGPWTIVGTVLTLKNFDGSTAHVFNLDSDTAPTSRTDPP